MWYGIIDDMLTGFFILDDRMTGHNYLDLPEQLKDVSFVTRITMYFQHDEVPSQYGRLVMQHLSDTSPNRWIGHGNTINWPPWSPDLTPLDFCLLGWIESKFYRRKVDRLGETLINIMNVIVRIKERQDSLRRATPHVLTQVANCIDTDGGIFEDMLY
jgi:hypothetical protein